jgi:hypothetical protein
MPLQRTDAKIERESRGFVFPMRIVGTMQTVQVVVKDEVFTAFGWPVDGELRAQFDADRSELEALAREKYDHGRASADGVVSIGLSDVVSFFQ